MLAPAPSVVSPDPARAVNNSNLNTQKLADDPPPSDWPIGPMLVAMGDVWRTSPWTWEHLGRVARYAVVFGRELGLRGASFFTLQCAAMLHDVGKVTIPPELLDKETPLERDEWYSITKHPVTSSKMIRAQDIRVEVISAAQSHHEWYNGKGYPLGLAGEAIPLAARVLSMADAYDAMSSDRPYRKALSAARIKEEIEKGAGAQFDPNLVRDLLPLLEVGVEEGIPHLRMWVVSNDPALYGELWFGAYPLGWDLEVWPPQLAEEMHGADNRKLAARPGHELGSSESEPDLVVIDKRCTHLLPEGALESITVRTLWIDPLHETTDNASNNRGSTLRQPLDLTELHAAINTSLYVGTRERQKAGALRVLVADPYRLFRQALRRSLNEIKDVIVAAEAATPHEYREAQRTHEYDVAIVASDLISGTHSTSPLSRAGDLLNLGETPGLGAHKSALVLVADEDLEDFNDRLDPTHIYIHRGAPIEELVEALMRVAQA